MSNKLPAVVSQIPPDLRMFLDRVRDIVRAAGRERLITADDLAALKLANINAQGTLTPSITVPSVLPPPPAPANVTATAAVQTVFVEWDAPAYFGHAYAEVWTAGVDDLSQAVLLGMSPGSVFIDTPGFSATRYYWVRFVNTDDIKGPFNDIAGTTATTSPDLSYIMDVLSDTFGGASAAPFFQIDQPTVIGGVTIPAGTYMKSAFIYDGVITNAKIGSLAVDNAKIANVSAAKLTAGSIAVGQHIQSSNYIASTQGWRIDGNGNAEFQNAVVRGTVFATDGQFLGTLLGGSATTYTSGLGFFSGLQSGAYRWRVGSPTGARIQWTGSAVEVYNGSNQLTLSSGGIDYSFVTGTKPPPDADRTAINIAAGIAGQGVFATLNQITAANATTYIANAAIGNNLIVAGTITADRIQANAIAVTQTGVIGGNVTTVATFGVPIPSNSSLIGSLFIFNASNVSQRMLLTGTGRSGVISGNTAGEFQSFAVFDAGTMIFDYGWSPAGEDAKAFGVTIIVPANSSKTIQVRAAKTSNNVSIGYTMTLSTLGVRN